MSHPDPHFISELVPVARSPSHYPRSMNRMNKYPRIVLQLNRVCKREVKPRKRVTKRALPFLGLRASPAFYEMHSGQPTFDPTS